jgi:hypothetical protein
MCSTKGEAPAPFAPLVILITPCQYIKSAFIIVHTKGGKSVLAPPTLHSHIPSTRAFERRARTWYKDTYTVPRSRVECAERFF